MPNFWVITWVGRRWHMVLAGKVLGRLNSVSGQNGWITYNLPYTVLDMVRSNVVGRSPGADYNHFLPGIIPRANELGRVDDLSLEAFLRTEKM